MIRTLHLTFLAGPYGTTVLAVAVALGVAAGGLAVLRWRPVWAGAVGPLTVLAGWAVLLPRAGAWLRPGGVAEHLVVPAIAAVAAGTVRGRVGERAGRWLGVAGLVFGAWWVAKAAGDDFWRAWLGIVVLGAVLARFGERAGAGAWALCGGLVAGGAGPVWAGVAAVLGAGGLAGRSGLVGLGGLLAMAAGAAELGAGRLARGRVGTMELACAAAVLAPVVAGWVERWFAGRAGRRWGWLARGFGVVGAACLGIGAAWAGGRLLRS